MSIETAVQKVLSGQSTGFGFWLTLPCAAVAKTILRSSSSFANSKFSWVLIDAEHGLISDQHYYELTTAVASEGASPLIRVPWGEEWLIKRALDAGAHGIVTPMCHTEEDAIRIVSHSKYPPLGTRGYGPMFAPHSMPGVAPGNQHDSGANKALMVVVQIESKSGVENVEKIAQVDGIDVLFIGPFDLALQTGLERGGEEHEAAVQRILKAAHSAGKKAAIFCTDGNDAKLRTEQGFDLVSVCTDVGVLGEGMIRALETASSTSKGDNATRGSGY